MNPFPGGTAKAMHQDQVRNDKLKSWLTSLLLIFGQERVARLQYLTVNGKRVRPRYPRRTRPMESMFFVESCLAHLISERGNVGAVGKHLIEFWSALGMGPG